MAIENTVLATFDPRSSIVKSVFFLIAAHTVCVYRNCLRINITETINFTSTVIKSKNIVLSGQSGDVPLFLVVCKNIGKVQLDFHVVLIISTQVFSFHG